MTDSTTQRTFGQTILGPWRNLGRRGRVAFALALALVVGIAAVGLSFWWGETWPPRLTLRGTGAMIPIAVSPDGKTLLTDDDFGLALWDAVSGARLTPWENPSSRKVFRGEYTPDGRTFVAFAYDAATRTNPLIVGLLGADVGRVWGSVTLDQTGVLGHAFSADGRRLRVVTSGPSPEVHVADVDLETGRLIEIRPLKVPPAYFPYSLSPDGKILATAQQGANIKSRDDVVMWDIDGDREAFRLTGTEPVTGLAFSHDGATLAIGREGGKVELLNVASRRTRTAFSLHAGTFDPLWINFSPDDRTLTSYARWSRAGWNVETARVIVSGHNRNSSLFPQDEMTVLEPGSGRILGRIPAEGRATFSRDGRVMATGHLDGSVRVRDLPSR